MFDTTLLSPPNDFLWEADWETELAEVTEELASLEAQISRLRAEQLNLVRTADRLQADLADGDRTMVDWLVERLDVSTQTARRLLQVAKAGRAEVEEAMRRGDYGIDRADILCRLAAAGAPDEVLQNPLDYSLGSLYGLLDDLRRISRHDEIDAYRDRYLVLQPSLDRATTRFWGQTSGTDAEVLQRAVDRRETQLPVLPDQTRGQRAVDALVSICLDSLTGTHREGPRRAVAVAEVFVDAAAAASSRGERGARLSTGPRVGPATLEDILCEGQVRTTYLDEEGKPVATSRKEEAVPPAVRRFVFHRDRGVCQLDGNRYRVQIHHIVPRSQGGDHDPDNLILLCWYHHHVAIHMMGMELDPDSPPHRRRLLPLFHRAGNNHDPPP